MPEGGLRTGAGGGRDAAGQCALAEPEPAGGVPGRERLAQMHVDVLLDLVDDQVVMRSFAAERDVGGLTGAMSGGEEYLGGQIRPVVTGEAFPPGQDHIPE